MDFSRALIALKQGMSVTRTGWNGKDLRVILRHPSPGSDMTLPFLFLMYPHDAAMTPGAKVPWAPTQTDILAEDWEIAKINEDWEIAKKLKF